MKGDSEALSADGPESTPQAQPQGVSMSAIPDSDQIGDMLKMLQQATAAFNGTMDKSIAGQGQSAMAMTDEDENKQKMGPAAGP